MDSVPNVCWYSPVHDVDGPLCDLNPVTPERSWYERTEFQELAVGLAICLAAVLIKRPSACLTIAQAMFWSGKK